MTTVNIHEAKTHFSRLVESAARGEPVTIAKAGRPMVKLVRIDTEEAPPRTGFLQGQASIPDDFDSIASDDLVALFEGRA